MRVEIVHTGGRFAERVVECLSSFVPGQVEAYLVPRVFTAALEDGADSLPTGLGSGALIIAINLPTELLLTIPPLVGGAGVQALLVPLEDPGWVKPGVQRQVAQLGEERGLEVAFPHPFCALAATTPAIAAFAEEFGVGPAEVRFELAEGRVEAVDVLRGAPCGLTDHLSEQLWRRPQEHLAAETERIHAAYPCLASTQADPATGRSAFAFAREQHGAAVAKALAEAAR